MLESLPEISAIVGWSRVVANSPHVHEVEPAFAREQQHRRRKAPDLGCPTGQRRRNIIRDPLHVERDVEIALGEKPHVFGDERWQEIVGRRVREGQRFRAGR